MFKIIICRVANSVIVNAGGSAEVSSAIHCRSVAGASPCRPVAVARCMLSVDQLGHSLLVGCSGQSVHVSCRGQLHVASWGEFPVADVQSIMRGQLPSVRESVRPQLLS